MLSVLAIALAFQLQIPAPVGYVNDFAGVIDPASQRALLAVIDEVRAKSGGEIVVVTLADLGGRASIDVARDIGREWQVGARGGPGDRARNAGVILLLKPGQRPGDGRADLAIATGTGAEGFVTDARAGRIRDAIGRASVERRSYGQGLVAGVWLLAEAYAGEFGFQLTGERRPRLPAGAREAPMPGWARGLSMALTLGVFLLFIALAAGARRSLGYRRYYGPRHSGLGWLLLGTLMSGGRRGGGGRGGWGGGWGGGGFGGGFGGFGGSGGFGGGGASGRF